MKNKISFVITGTGNIANTYLKAISKVEEAEIVGVVPRTGKKPADFPEIPSFTSLQEIQQKFDAVIICTPNGYHHLGTLEAAALGKHILCDKPIDITLDAIDKMMKACRKKKIKLGVVYQRRFSSDNPAIKRLIAGGKLCHIFSVDLTIRNYRDVNYYNSASYRGTWKVDGGGPYMQQASHYIDLYQWYFGRSNQIVCKISAFVHDIEVEDHGAVLCFHDSGMISTITASTATKPGFPATLGIYSDKGWLKIENDLITQWEIEGLENPVKQNSATEHTGSSSPLVADTRNHEFAIKDFIEAINTDRDPLVGGESTRITTENFLKIYRNQI